MKPYILENDYHYYSDRLKGIYLATEYVFICDGYITIKKVYSWNGCTFAPDFKATYHASLIHDAMYQFEQPRRIADLLFLEQMRKDNFCLSYFYYFSVRLFGSFFY